MSDSTHIPDQDDVLAINERLSAENTRWTGELTAATELLETAQGQATAAAQSLPRFSPRFTASKD